MRRPSGLKGLALMSLAGAVVLSGCGFTPLYGDTGVSAGLSRISVITPDDRLGYRLREQLDDALGRDGRVAPVYNLSVEVEQERRPLGRRLDDTATRYELTVVANWMLTSATGAGAPLTGVSTTTVTYGSADQPYAAIAAQQDGEERAAADMARLIRLDLMRALAGQP